MAEVPTLYVEREGAWTYSVHDSAKSEHLMQSCLTWIQLKFYQAISLLHILEMALDWLTEWFLEASPPALQVDADALSNHFYAF